jgi:integrase
MHANDARAGSLYTTAGQRKYLTAAERSRFVNAALSCRRAELRALCLTLVYTGCRISEALAITPKAIERQAGFIAIRSLKKRKRIVMIREVPVPIDLFQALEEAHEFNDRDTLLWPLSRTRAWQLVKHIMREAAVPEGPHMTPKGLRHSFGIHAIRSGVPLNLVQRWLGHASMTTTAIYLNALGEEEREIAARMWATPISGADSSARQLVMAKLT